MARSDFDWIDDAFDDKRLAEDMEKAKGPKLAALLLVFVALAAVALIVFALVAIPSSLS